MARLLIDVLYHYRKQAKYSLHEFVLMSDHFHCLITLNDDLSVERAVQFIKGGFSYRVKQELHSAMEIWQRGFSDHRLRDAADFHKYRDYIHSNPVTAKITLLPRDYEYSSCYPGYVLDVYPVAKATVEGNSDGTD